MQNNLLRIFNNIINQNGGNQTLANMIILENEHLFSYTLVKEAELDEMAKNKANIKKESLPIYPIPFSEKDRKYRAKKVLNLPIRKYKKVKINLVCI